MINGNEYAFEDVTGIWFGRPIIGIQGVEYTSKKEHVNIKGWRNKPVAKGRGGEDFEGRLTILQSEFEALQRQIPGSKATQLDFDLVVSYAPMGGVPTTDILKSCRITEVKKGIKTDDKNMVVELPLVIFDIDYNV